VGRARCRQGSAGARDLLAPIARGVAELPLLGHLATKTPHPCASRGPATRATWATRSGSGARTPCASGTRSGQPVAVATSSPSA
jgi:hypothetical protein